ncbi:glutamate receptor ionotropic, NMDA 3A-like isoform X2 [Daktulosphaira vitifoliae]|uniref:glutamate receptor ionotropic, NMDA 3A-like isoform X2 n=1 Tax=Daktulosphaira vitifoliae TaxID=58002 RepID=UPI0021AB09AE|nr:glutamate receptor ionotropic, NMDA 3A-like isoform X2 [Daktulosphaira vitifoliae]
MKPTFVVFATLTLLPFVLSNSNPVYVSVIHGHNQGSLLSRTMDRAMPPSVRALYAELPANKFSMGALEAVLDLWANKTIIACLLLIPEPVGLLPALTASKLRIPVLWLPASTRVDQERWSELVVRVAITPWELFSALRSFLLHADWHKFYILHSMMITSEVQNMLSESPLSYTSIPISTYSSDKTLFRSMVELSTSEASVVVVVGDRQTAQTVWRQATLLGLLPAGNIAWLWLDVGKVNNSIVKKKGSVPVGMLSLRPVPLETEKHTVRAAVRVFSDCIKDAMATRCKDWTPKTTKVSDSCVEILKGNDFPNDLYNQFNNAVHDLLSGKSIRRRAKANGEKPDLSFAVRFDIMNSISNKKQIPDGYTRAWKKVGAISPSVSEGQQIVKLDSVVWAGNKMISGVGIGRKAVYRVVTAIGPPFVMHAPLPQDRQCLRGIRCYQMTTTDKDNITMIFKDIKLGFNDKFVQDTFCCFGLVIDLLEKMSSDLEFDFHLYLVADGLFGSRKIKWNGVVGDLVSGSAHMAFCPLSITSARSKWIEFSTPYFYSGVSMMVAPKRKTNIPLLAFLLPLSPNLWIAIFVSLHVTTVAVALYEWFSPFGLNPAGRQRSKNFGMPSALWAMWGLLCGALVNFKAPKSWPNKFLINVWGGFCVIFVASYTANIAALIASLLFQNAKVDYNERNILTLKVGAAKSSAAEFYLKEKNPSLWQQIQKYHVPDTASGMRMLRNGSLDIFVGDRPILDYYSGTDHDCKLTAYGDPIHEDVYAVGMTKNFILKEKVSGAVSKYVNNGFMDILQNKWFNDLPCIDGEVETSDMGQPTPLGVDAFLGVFLMLGFGILAGFVILCFEHAFYHFTLPKLRQTPPDSFWRSQNMMFVSQKLYKFINSVELISPQHTAKELVHTLRQGQIASLFQKSVRRKEFERKKRKGQFFEVIEEIRRIQREERDNKKQCVRLSLSSSPTGQSPKPNKFLSPSRLNLGRRYSKQRSRSSGNLTIRRYSTDVVSYSENIGRRLSQGASNSPPDFNTRRQLIRRSSGNPSPADSSRMSIFSASELIGAKLSNNNLYVENDLPRSPNLLSPGVFFRSSFSSDTSSSRPDLGNPSRKSSYSQGPPRVVINGEQQPLRRKSDDEPSVTLPKIVEGKRARRSSDGHRPKNRKTVEMYRVLKQVPKNELEAMSKMSEDEIKSCILQALQDKDPT